MPRERSSTPKLASILMHLVDLMFIDVCYPLVFFVSPNVPMPSHSLAGRSGFCTSAMESSWEDSLRWKLNFNWSFRECTKKYRGKEQTYIGVNGKQSITK
jgi:hypothetical protein